MSHWNTKSMGITKIWKRYWALLCVLLAIPSYSFGKCIYVSQNGSDQNDGLSVVSPWQTLSKLQTQLHLLQAGDSILLKRGDVFYGSINIERSGLPGKYIYLGAYGNGLNPVIKGSVEVSNWELHKPNVWKTDCHSCTAEPIDLYIEGTRQPLGKYPNEGYLLAKPTGSYDSQFTDESLHFENEYWKGAEIAVRSSRWTIDVVPVKAFKDKTFHFERPASYILPHDLRYFIQKHPQTLSTTGEWYFNRESKEISLYTNAYDPNNKNVEISIYDEGLTASNSSFIIIDGIHFTQQRLTGVTLKKSSNIILRNCRISFSGHDGINVTSSNKIKIDSNSISDCNNNGIEWKENTNSTITNNKVHRIGLQPGLGESGNGTYIGINITGGSGHNTLVQYNNIDSTGYTAIDFRTGHTEIRNNYIHAFCLIKDDGGAIYTWKNNFGNNKIADNIIIGTPLANTILNGDQSYRYGIYIDDRSKDIAISGNTVASCDGAGIFIHNASHLYINKNILVANGNYFNNKEKAQLVVKRDDIVQGDEPIIEKLVLVDNTLISTRSDQRCISFYFPDQSQVFNAAHFLVNRYAGTQTNLFVIQIRNPSAVCQAQNDLTLSQWQQLFESDKGSILKIFPYPSLVSTKYIYRNGNKKSIDGWNIWPDKASMGLESTKTSEIYALKVDPIFPESSPVMLYHNGFNFDHDKMYELSFTIKTAKMGEIEFVPLAVNSPWTALDDYACFKTDTIPKKFTHQFIPSSSNEGRLNFKSNQTFWISDINLKEVVINNSPDTFYELYTNNAKTEIQIATKDKLTYLNGTPAESLILLPPYSSLLLFRP